MSMIKLSTGVEISEDTIISALKKAGINTEPPEPKFGDFVKYRGGDVRIWLYDRTGKLCAFDNIGRIVGSHSYDYIPTGKSIFDLI